MQTIMQIIYTLMAAAALIGIKALDLPVPVTILLVAATVIACMLLFSGLLSKKKSA
ncbi:MAG: hypothetical protein HY911_16320 [Desulfobacterales bacterium]|nr:hypothetical protein [Desulfobacterales bacterium]